MTIYTFVTIKLRSLGSGLQLEISCDLHFAKLEMRSIKLKVKGSACEYQISVYRASWVFKVKIDLFFK